MLGETEKAICTIKTLFQKVEDSYATLLVYGSTPVCYDTTLQNYLWTGNCVQWCQSLQLSYSQQWQIILDLRRRRRQWQKSDLENLYHCLLERVYGLQNNRHQELLFKCFDQDHIKFRPCLECCTDIEDISNLFGTLPVREYNYNRITSRCDYWNLSIWARSTSASNYKSTFCWC